MHLQFTSLILLFSVFACVERPESAFEHITLNFYKSPANDSVYFLTYTDDSTEVYRTAPADLDLESLEDHGEYLTDKYSAYAWYATSSGSFLFKMKQVDRESFEALDNSIYAKDRYRVYTSRNGAISDADPTTFELVSINLNGRIAHGKDSLNYYFWNQVVTDTVGFYAALQSNVD